MKMCEIQSGNKIEQSPGCGMKSDGPAIQRKKGFDKSYTLQQLILLNKHSKLYMKYASQNDLTIKLIHARIINDHLFRYYFYKKV